VKRNSLLSAKRGVQPFFDTVLQTYSSTFKHSKTLGASWKKTVFWKRLDRLMMNTFLYRTLLENSVDINQREFYCIKITSFKSSNMRVSQGFLALGNNF
jgi:hypothetical protein